jgi:hypothetical protein
MLLTGTMFTATGDDAVLNVGDLESALAISNIALSNGAVGSQTGDITVATDVAWSAHKLNLMAYHSTIIQAQLSATATATLKLAYAHGGALVFNGGRVTFQSTSESLQINSIVYTLVSSVAMLSTDISSVPSGKYALTDNIDAGYAPVYPKATIGTEFIGDFEGLGNTISNLTISDHTSGDSDALFSWLGPNGSIENLGLTNVSISNDVASGSATVAALAALNQGTISNITADGTESLTQGNAGGVVASNNGVLQNSSASVSITQTKTDSAAGGLVGTNIGTISNSSASGTITNKGTSTGYLSVGGLVGTNEGSIALSFAGGSVNGGESDIGGLVGKNSGGSIDQTYASGTVTGNGAEGGLVGYTVGGNGITNSYATGAVNGFYSNTVGGLLGYNQSSPVGYSYSLGAPTGLSGSSIGGFVGTDYTTAGSNTDDYWNTTTSALTQAAGNLPSGDPGVTGLTSTELKAGLPDGFDSNIWHERSDINLGYPYLRALPPS